MNKIQNKKLQNVMYTPFLPQLCKLHKIGEIMYYVSSVTPYFLLFFTFELENTHRAYTR